MQKDKCFKPFGQQFYNYEVPFFHFPAVFRASISPAMAFTEGQPPGAAPSRQAMFNVPRLVLALIGVNVAVHLVTSGLGQDAFMWVLIHLAFIPIRYSVEGLGGWAAWLGPFSHQFLHGGWLHLVMNMVMLAAFGSPVERIVGRRSMLVLYLLSGVLGAFTHFSLFPGSNVPVVGASGAISGLFGAVLWLMARPNQWGQRNMRFWPAALIWITISVAIGFTGMPGVGDGQIAWAAHIGGFAGGILIMMVMLRWARLLRAR